jgi:hypothetical protein
VAHRIISEQRRARDERDVAVVKRQSLNVASRQAHCDGLTDDANCVEQTRIGHASARDALSGDGARADRHADRDGGEALCPPHVQLQIDV